MIACPLWGGRIGGFPVLNFTIMPKLVVMGAMCQCTMGAAPSSLMVLPSNKVPGCKVPAANIMDNIPMTNIMPFGTCQILTASASGVPTPCVPATAAPWTPGASKTMIANMPALTDSSTCMCSIGGTISITNAGQTTIDVS